MEKIETKEKNIFNKIDKIDLIYLGVIFIFLIIIIILFFNSTSFIVKNVNKVFSQTNEVNSHALNMGGYALVEKKLKLPVNNTSNDVTIINTEQAIVPMDAQATAATTPVAPIVPEVIKPVLDNKTLTISVLNGARKAGVAGAMVADLEAAGFAKGTAGDSKTIYPITTIMIKDTKKEYTKALEDAVKKNHPKAVTKVNPEKSEFDVIVIVGKE